MNLCVDEHTLLYFNQYPEMVVLPIHPRVQPWQYGRFQARVHPLHLCDSPESFCQAMNHPFHVLNEIVHVQY